MYRGDFGNYPAYFGYGSRTVAVRGPTRCTLARTATVRLPSRVPIKRSIDVKTAWTSSLCNLINTMVPSKNSPDLDMGRRPKLKPDELFKGTILVVKLASTSSSKPSK